LLILKLKQTISLQNYILSEPLGPSSGLYRLETSRQIQLILHHFYINAQTSILILQWHNMSWICLQVSSPYTPDDGPSDPKYLVWFRWH